MSMMFFTFISEWLILGEQVRNSVFHLLSIEECEGLGRGRPFSQNGLGGIRIREHSTFGAGLPAASTMPTWRSYQTDLPALRHSNHEQNHLSIMHPFTKQRSGTRLESQCS